MDLRYPVASTATTTVQYVLNFDQWIENILTPQGTIISAVPETVKYDLLAGRISPLQGIVSDLGPSELSEDLSLNGNMI